MARYCIDLYFDKELSREKLQGRIATMAGCQPVADQPDNYCFEHVHISLGHLTQSKTADEIRQATGLEVNDLHVEVYVHTATDEAFEERWDRALDLLADGKNAVAVHESEWILLTQRNGQLTLDDTGEILSPYYRDYILSKRPAELASLGSLG